MKMEHCPECSKVLGMGIRHTGKRCEPGKSIYAPSTEEYLRARMFFEVATDAD